MSDRDRRRRRDGAGHVATSPDFPELTTFGDDRDEALARAVGALEEAVAARIHRAALAGERDGRPPDARIAGSEVHNRGTDARAAGGAGTGSMKQAETGSDPRAARRKLPIGIRTFREIREEGCYYVDKTAYVRRLMDEGKHYFLSRPRRFGKSLLVDTIEELFEGNEPRFRGLAAVVLYLALCTVLWLGLQVSPAWGTAGFAGWLGLVAAWIWWTRRRGRRERGSPRPASCPGPQRRSRP